MLQDEFSSGKVSRLTRGDGECCEGVALDATLVPPQGVAAGGAGVRHLRLDSYHIVHISHYIIRRREIHFFQHSNVASPDFCAEVAI